MLKEISGISKILKAFPDTHFVYASTKVVYGVVDQLGEISRDDVIDKISESVAGKHINTIVDLPQVPIHVESLDSLSKEHQIYAHTKLCAESMVKYCADTYTIFRIWDIT
jgi:nucleoside-diphosphate-sugar epimerase